MHYTKQHLSKKHSKRPGKLLKATSITIHNTANLKSTAKNERQWLDNPMNTRTASWHIVVDDYEAIEAIPLNEVAWHAGPKGNAASIGIELCESGDWQRTKANGIQLIATLLLERGWGLDSVKQHRHWTGKNCPRKLIPEWDDFIKGIEAQLKAQRMTQRKTGVVNGGK